MCEPTTWIMLATTIASTGATMYAANEAKHDAAENAQRQLDADTDALQLAQNQANDAAADKMSERAREARKERARIRTASGESGVAGNLADKLLNGSFMSEGMDIASMENNRKNGEDQTALEYKSARFRADDRNNSVKGPDYFGAGLQIAGAGLDTYSSYQQGKRAASLSIG